MRQIMRSNKTRLSVVGNKISIDLGPEMDETNTQRFMEIIDNILDNVDGTFHGHFACSKDHIEIVLSNDSVHPVDDDKVWRLDW